VGGECFCFGLAKNIYILVIFLWNRGEIDFFEDGGRFGLYCGTKLEEECF